jgi:hypothetical protein
VHPEDVLDVLLTERARSRVGGGSKLKSSRSDRPVGDEFAPLLDAVARLDPLADAMPSDAFTADLEQRLMAQMRRQPSTPQQRRSPRVAMFGGVARGPSRLAWAGIAAALALTVGLGVFTAHAAPGQPLYPVRQFAQSVASDAFTSPADKSHSALLRAQADLAAYNAAIARGDAAAAMTTLTSLRADDAEAAASASAVNDHGAQQAAQAQVALFRQGAQTDLRQSLTALGWQERAQVTDALRSWGNTSLLVRQAHVFSDSGTSQSSHSAKAADTVLIQVNGAGFSAGAQLLVNGQRVGTLVTLSSNVLTVRAPASLLDSDSLVVGVEEGDGTVALAAHVTRDGADQPGQAATPSSGDHSGDHSGAPGDGATPSPGDTPARTPSPEPTSSAGSK